MAGSEPPADTAADDTVRPVAALFGAIADELAALTDLALTIQAVLGPILSHSRQEVAVHRVAQSLDLMTQRLDGLQDFLATTGSSVPGDWHLDCSVSLQTIRLGDLARRLKGVSNLPDPGHAGSIEMF